MFNERINLKRKIYKLFEHFFDTENVKTFMCQCTALEKELLEFYKVVA